MVPIDDEEQSRTVLDCIHSNPRIGIWPSPYECPRSTLFKMLQTGMVQDYYKEFTALANRVQGITANTLLDSFISGLKIDIRRNVIAQNPTSLLRDVSLAKLFEEK